MAHHKTHRLLEKFAKADVQYYSNSSKDLRELDVVSEFLSLLGIIYKQEELISPQQASHIDVCFRDAQFQVKELTNPKLRRGKMYKDILNSIKTAKSIEEISYVGDTQDIPPVANMYDLILQKSRELANSNKYCAVKSVIDLLFHVTRTRASLIRDEEINSEDFSDLGWRSVSCVNSKQAVILYAAPLAPKFITEKSL